MRRGTTLLEAMVSFALFAIGVLGALQLLMIASRQNTVAGRMTHAGGIARQVRSELVARGRTWAVSPVGPLSQGRCTTDPAVTALAGPMQGLGCVIDLDAYEAGGGEPLVRGYAAEDRDSYRRIAVLVPDLSVPPKVDAATVVVSFQERGQRRFVTQPLALYNVRANQAGVEL